MVDEQKATHFVFYSITSIEHGLSGVDIGAFLLHKAKQALKIEFANAKVFVTLSPVPAFCRWIRGQLKAAKENTLLTDSETKLLLEKGIFFKEDAERTSSSTTAPNKDSLEAVRPVLLKLLTLYLAQAKNAKNALKTYDPVANFHLRNGAVLHQVNWFADVSEEGMHQSLGMMVNYLYDADEKVLNENHAEYITKGTVKLGAAAQALLRSRL